MGFLSIRSLLLALYYGAIAIARCSKATLLIECYQK